MSRASRPTVVKTILFLIATGIVATVGVALARTVRFESDPPDVGLIPDIAIPAGASERLAASLRIPTISHEDPGAFDARAFQALHDYLRAAFPLVHARIRRETVATHSLLYTWPGSDSSLMPVLLVAHMDVVPVEPGTEARWEQDPFGGHLIDGFIWGRGAIDNKSAVVGILEAAEMLLNAGFQPSRTTYFAFGHDEEVGGSAGAREIAALLAKRGVDLALVLDEGGVIGEGIMPGIPGPIAMVGIAEKGFVSVELSTRLNGGHSSLPPRQTAIGVLSEAIARVEKRQMTPRLAEPTRLMFEWIGPALPFARRMVFANLWLTRPLVMRALDDDPTTNAMIRTTTAATVFEAGTKDNVLPGYARAVVNFRIQSGDSIAGVLEHVRRVVDDPRVQVRIGGRFTAEPSPVSSTETEAFRLLARTIQSTSPGTIIAPYQVVVVTDARHYAQLSSNIFRFLPLRLASDDIARIHGTNERIDTRDYEMAIRLYYQLLRNAAGS